MSTVVPATGDPDRLGTVLLVRHGRTDGNQHHYTGWEDLPLNATASPKPGPPPTCWRTCLSMRCSQAR